MGERWTAAGGWEVEVVELSVTTGRRRDGAWIRLTHRGFHVADVRDPAELERWVSLADLEADSWC